MWPAFNWLSRAPAVPAQAPVPDTPDLGTRLDALEKQMRDFQLMRLEWAEVLDKLTAWTNRQSARDAKRVKALVHDFAQDAPETTNEAEGAPRPGLTKAELRRALSARLHQRSQALGGGE